MCLGPELLISAGLQAVGGAINSRSQRKNQQRQINARNASRAEEQLRQDVFQQQAGDRFDQTLADIRNNQSEEGTQQIIDTRNIALQRNLDEAPRADFSSNVSSTAPKVVQETIAAKLSDALANSKGYAQRLAKLGGLQDQAFQNNLALVGGGRDISTVNNFSRNSNNINGAEQSAAANNAIKASSGIGDLFGIAGQGLGLFGQSGGTIFKQPVYGPFQPGASIPKAPPSIFGSSPF